MHLIGIFSWSLTDLFIFYSPSLIWLSFLLEVWTGIVTGCRSIKQGHHHWQGHDSREKCHLISLQADCWSGGKALSKPTGKSPLPSTRSIPQTLMVHQSRLYYHGIHEKALSTQLQMKQRSLRCIYVFNYLVSVITIMSSFPELCQ